jgi:two-component system chemotaxis sensor kinase CheA
MKTRMQPIGSAWQKLPRMVRDLCRELGKQIDFRGADTELDRQVLALIKDPLTHMIRNSADHGLENPGERRAVGKPERGSIRLAALTLSAEKQYLFGKPAAPGRAAEWVRKISPNSSPT